MWYSGDCVAQFGKILTQAVRVIDIIFIWAQKGSIPVVEDGKKIALFQSSVASDYVGRIT